MIGKLSENQIDHVLRSKLIGRIGCHADGRTYVVPVAYVMDNGYIYAHSRTGQKVTMMRKNPRVCFQVDDIDSLANWRSVVIDGQFEELKTETLQTKAFNLLKDRLSPLVTSDAARPSDVPPPGEKKLRPIFYRIKILEKSGRYEIK